MNMRNSIFILLMVAVCIFFWREMQSNWEQFSGAHFKLRWPYFILGGCFFCASCLVTTWSWLETVRVVTGKKLTFSESFGIFNVSQLAKYIPGKIWSFGLQMYWLSR